MELSQPSLPVRTENPNLSSQTTFEHMLEGTCLHISAPRERLEDSQINPQIVRGEEKGFVDFVAFI